MIDKAIKIAAEVHEGQVDKGKVPYILHALAVMGLVDVGGLDGTFPEQTKCAAVLHDTVEDLEGKPGDKDLLKDTIDVEFGYRVGVAIKALTRKEGESYDDYIERISGDWMARRVKIADLTHNMDPSRLPSGEIKDYDFKRWDKYRRALIRLKRKD